MLWNLRSLWVYESITVVLLPHSIVMQSYAHVEPFIAISKMANFLQKIFKMFKNAQICRQSIDTQLVEYLMHPVFMQHDKITVNVHWLCRVSDAKIANTQNKLDFVDVHWQFRLVKIRKNGRIRQKTWKCQDYEFKMKHFHH